MAQVIGGVLLLAQVSDGQRRRVQLAVGLMRPFEVGGGGGLLAQSAQSPCRGWGVAGGRARLTSVRLGVGVPISDWWRRVRRGCMPHGPALLAHGLWDFTPRAPGAAAG